ncbi:hypothetical protein [Variovorax sp. tm]|uniref:hypothetical protein n=1 Tax=Variovorax atrisoli TaxID=3394203 RepID=UPI003A7FD5A0
MNSPKHPLSAALPSRSQDELTSIERCEGLVQITAEELRALCASAWFKRKSAGYRALIVVSHCEWAAAGSNQHGLVPDSRSPRAAARIAQELVVRVASHA